MLNLDTIIHKKLQLLEEDEKDLNPFFVSKEKVMSLLKQKGKEHQQLFERIELLAQLFNFSEKEQNIILIVLAPTIDIKYQKIYAYLQDDLNKKEATVFLLSLLLSEADEEQTNIYSYLQAQSPLMLFQIIETDRSSNLLKISESVQNFLFGSYILDDKVTAYSSLLTTLKNSSYNLDTIERNITSITEGLSEQKRFVIHLQGQDSSHKEYIATNIANRLEYALLKVDLSTLLAYSDNFDETLNLLFRESILSGSLLYFDHYDTFSQDEKFHIYQALLVKKFNNFSGLSFISSNVKITPLPLSNEQLWFEILLQIPSITQSSLYWRDSLKNLEIKLSIEKSDKLANLFNFSLEQIESIVQQLKTQLFFGEKFTDALLYQLCRESVSSSLDSLAQPLNTPNTMDDIILPKEKKKLLIEVTKHYQHQFQVFETWGFKKHYQSQGIALLLTGASGTGKTMAASILANELGLDLYRIELSRIVSKYIGETEKNLSKIFNTAQGSGVVLFFDEADAIFGKRTETKNSHDRYANIEVSYLLQKIEEYNGLVILASNFRQNIDEAFIRRMRFIINFPFPDTEMRKKIWEKVFPKDSPIDQDIDFSVLAKNFEFSGANIRNASLFAAFFAVKNDEIIQLEHIIEGVKVELRKLGKSVKESDFTKIIAKKEK